jgi:DNA-binding MarR family transcriptional regulator
MPNTISSLIASLRQAGLIAQVTHPSDGRKRIIKITDVGKAVLADLGPHQRTFVQELFENFSDEEIRSFSQLLNKLLSNVTRLLGRENIEDKCDPVQAAPTDQQPV